MQADCAIVTALPLELDAVLFHFRHSRKIALNTGGEAYQTTSGNGLELVAAVSSGYGRLPAARLAQELLETVNPKLLLLVGIAGGLNQSMYLGDVVAAERIIDYEYEDSSLSGSLWPAYEVDNALLSRIQNWRNQSWQDYIRVPRPEGSQRPQLHTGVYLSVGRVIADEHTAEALRSVSPKSAAVDMEAATLAAALRHMRKETALMVFRGICDYADSRKSRNWREYSADAAASCAFSFILEQLQSSDLENVKVNPLRIFLCHGSEDKNVIRSLYDDLKRDGMLPWLDEIDLAPGVEWEPTIRRAVRESDIVLVCLSRRSIEKTGFVQKEIRIALDAADDRPEGLTYIIPAKIENCPLPERLSRWQAVNLFDGAGYSKLIASLEKHPMRNRPQVRANNKESTAHNLAPASDGWRHR